MIRGVVCRACGAEVFGLGQLAGARCSKPPVQARRRWAPPTRAWGPRRWRGRPAYGHEVTWTDIYILGNNTEGVRCGRR